MTLLFMANLILLLCAIVRIINAHLTKTLNTTTNQPLDAITAVLFSQELVLAKFHASAALISLHFLSILSVQCNWIRWRGPVPAVAAVAAVAFMAATHCNVS